MIQKTHILFALIFFIAPDLFSQNKVMFLSGETLITSHYEIKIDDGMLVYQNKHNKDKQVGLEYIFSITDSLGNENIIYEASVMEDISFSVEQMKRFINGEITARNHYHAPIASLTGFASGAGGIFLVPALGWNVFYAPLVPALSSTMVGATHASRKRIERKYPEYANDEYFIMGYTEVAQQKRITNTLKGAGLGIVAGIISAIALSNVR